MGRIVTKNMQFFMVILIGITLLSACSYDSEKAIRNGDVINMHGPVYNYDIFESFLTSIDAKEADSVRISNFTLEGNPTFYNLNYDGSSIHFEIDHSKNKKRDSGPTKVTTTCTNLVTEVGQQLTSYMLEGCDNDAVIESFVILTVNFDTLF